MRIAKREQISQRSVDGHWRNDVLIAAPISARSWCTSRPSPRPRASCAVELISHQITGIPLAAVRRGPRSANSEISSPKGQIASFQRGPSDVAATLPA